jgi:hypothetical protein
MEVEEMIDENKKRKKKRSGITLRVPLDEVQEDSTFDKVINLLKSNPKYAYTIIGLVVELYKYDPEDLNASFKDWPKGAPSQYTRVRLALEKLKKEGKIEAKKQGKKGLYWWKSSDNKSS